MCKRWDWILPDSAASVVIVADTVAHKVFVQCPKGRPCAAVLGQWWMVVFCLRMRRLLQFAFRELHLKAVAFLGLTRFQFLHRV